MLGQRYTEGAKETWATLTSLCGRSGVIRKHLAGKVELKLRIKEIVGTEEVTSQLEWEQSNLDIGKVPPGNRRWGGEDGVHSRELQGIRCHW